MGDNNNNNTKVRLVRCPRCENLLPELPDYSVYQCGGCGAVLRAKKKGNVEDNKGLERSDEEKVGVVAEKPATEKSEDLVEKKRVSSVENEEVRVSNSEGVVSENVDESVVNDSRKEVPKRGVEVGDVSIGKSEVGNGSLESKVDKLEKHVNNGNGVRKSGRAFERNLSDIREEDRFARSRPSRRGYFDDLRSSSSNYVGEGPSKYSLDSSFKREGGGGMKVEDVEPDREELLRKLEELKDQLSRAQNDKFGEKFPPELRKAPREVYVEPEDCFRDHPSTFRHVSRQFSTANKHVANGAPYMDHYHDPCAPPNRSDIGTHAYHPSIHGRSYVPRYEDRLESQMFHRPPPHRIPSHVQYMRPELDHFEPHPYDMSLGHLPCSCYRCYDQQQIPPSSFGNRRFSHVPNNPVPRHHELDRAFGSHGYNPRMVNAPPLGSCEPKPNTRWPSDHKQERNACTRPRRVVLANGHLYRPIAGGAPFVTCRNCFELLKLPKRVFSKMGEWQMSCAACSTVISFAVVDEKLVSIDASSKETSTETLGSVNEIAPGYLKRDNGSYCSEDYANSVYDFQAMDRDPASSFTCQGVSSSKSDEMHNIHSVSATTSEDDPLSDDLATRQEVTFSAEPPENAVTSPPPVGSPPQDPFDYTSKYRAVNRCGKGNLSSRSDQERLMTNKNTLRQNSLKESLATEMEISPNEYANTKGSKDASDKSREDEQPKGKKGDSFLAGILKKSFRSNQTVESAKKNVTVNGHLIPDRLVKKAEKLAGPVYPGQYWYDYRAGFWGVIGGPCLGIVPPFIEEFNYPMPEHCAAGNTGVFVNGRELHQKDLDLLSSRGLPASKDRSYIVEITGRVVDEDTGKELDCLGKLAPTVEKVKHGFGMRAPKAVS